VEQVPGYIEFVKTQLGEQVIYRMRPEHWLSANIG
jgi:hypothetical protein